MVEKGKLASNKWVFVSGVIGLFTFATYAYFSAGFSHIFSVIRDLNVPLYTVAFLLVASGMMFNSLAWRSVLSTLDVEIGIARAYTLTWVGFFVDAVIPSGWSGDLFKAYLLTKDGNIKGGNSGAAAVALRLIVMSVGLISIIMGLILAIFIYHLPTGTIVPIIIVVSAFAISIAIAIVAATSPRMTRGLVTFTSRLTSYIRRKPWNPRKFQSRWGDALNTFQDGIKTFTAKKKTLIKPIIFAILAWTCEFLALLTVFNAVGYSIVVDKAFIVYSIGSALESQTAAFAGFAQVITSTLYIILRINSAISFAAVLLAGFSGFWFKLSVSYIAFSCVVLSRCLCSVATRLHIGTRHEGGCDQQKTGVAQQPTAA